MNLTRLNNIRFPLQRRSARCCSVLVLCVLFFGPVASRAATSNYNEWQQRIIGFEASCAWICG